MAEKTLLEKFSDDLAGVHQRVARSLVQVRRGGRSIGSGIVWNGNGLVLTNAHVVATRGRVSSGLSIGTWDGQELPARVVAADQERDLAALQVQGSTLSPIALGDSRSLEAGAWVMAFGYPFGIDDGATAGVVIGVGRSGPAGSVPEGEAPPVREASRGRDWLAAALHLRPGHSGGPMVDAQGRLVGINTMMSGPDVGVAVPIHVARDFMQQLEGAQREHAAAQGGPVWV